MLTSSEYKPNPFAPLLIRVSIGSYFFLLGVWGYIEPELSKQAIHKYSGFSDSLSGIYVSLACYLFFAIGLLMVLGLFTRIASLAGALIILPLLYGAGAFTPDGNNLVYFLEKRSLLREIVILAGCLSLTLSGGGALTLEGMLKGLSGKSN